MPKRNTQSQHNCLCCGKVYLDYAYRAATSRYCSKECYHAHRTRPVAERLQYRITADGCWEWTGYRCPGGYGRVGVRKGSQVAHRAYWEEVKGPIPVGMVVDHICRNRGCINIRHLRLVTAAQNTHLGKVMRGVFAWRGKADPA